MKYRMILFFWVGFLITMATASLVRAQAPEPPADVETSPSQPTDNDVNRVAKKLYCPVCPNTPLDVCETKACSDWRAQIREQLADGWSDKQVMDYFVLQYGERVLAEPERGGFTSLVWMLPVLAVILGLILVLIILRSWRVGKPAEAPASTDVLDVSKETLAKIEAEIRKLD